MHLPVRSFPWFRLIEAGASVLKPASDALASRESTGFPKHESNLCLQYRKQLHSSSKFPLSHGYHGIQFGLHYYFN